MEKKVIKQVGIVNLNIEVEVVDGKTKIIQSSSFYTDTIVVKPEHLKELALAICPQLSEDLQQAKELLERSMDFAFTHDKRVLRLEITAFLEGTK
jgi:hypothetical protein